jgi:hypothetical protein
MTTYIIFPFKESFLCDEDFCGGPCGPNCLPADGKECNGILVQLYDDTKVTGNFQPLKNKSTYVVCKYLMR